MSDSTQTSGMPIPPQIQGGAEVYDSIMKDIEPDLLSTNIETVDAQYAGKSPDEKKARMERYAKAFVEYQKRYEEYNANKQGEVRSFGRNVVQAVESKSADKDDKLLGEIESEISQAA